MNNYDVVEQEMEEPLSIRVEEPAANNKNTVSSWFRRIFTLDDIPNQKHHHPIFIIVMSTLHIFIHLLTYINISWKGRNFELILYDLFKFYVPCMRPTANRIRNRTVSCQYSMTNEICHYDDVLKHMCFPFMYPHQLWRVLTVNLLHTDWLHLLSNLLAQLVQGIPLERKYGSVLVIAIYGLSDLGASLTWCLKHRGEPAIGASGALYGLMLFLIVDRLIAMRTNTGHRLFIIIQLTALLLPHIAATIPLIIKYKVAHLAHFGSGLVGFLLGVGMLGCPWPWNSEPCISRKACRLLAFIFLILFYVITSTIFFLEETPTADSILYHSSLKNETRR